MTLRWLIPFMALIAGTVAPAAAQQYLAVTTTTVNMRTGPGTEYPVIVAVPANRQVQVTGCTPARDWCGVIYQARGGWISARYLSPPPFAGPPPKPVPIPPPQPPRPPVVFPPNFPKPPFFPNPPGQNRVNVVGTLTNQGVECRMLRADNGVVYSLTGLPWGYRPGDRVRVRGEIAEMSTCMQGQTIRVDFARPAN